MRVSPSVLPEKMLALNDSAGGSVNGDDSTNNDDASFTGGELDGPLVASGEMDCSYCRKPFRQPRLLHCLHAFCEDCIVAMLEGRSDEKPKNSLDVALEDDWSVSNCEIQTPPGVVRCPVCKQDSQIGNDLRFVQSLVPDFVTMNLQDANALERMQLVCESCKSKEKAVARCVDCANVLCPNCVQAHQFMRCFENHKVLTFEEIKNSGEDFLIHKPILCTTHTNEPIRFFCATCRFPVCNECLMTTHKFVDHNYLKSTPETDAQVREQLQKLLARGRGKVFRCESESHEMESKLQELNDSVDEARNSVEFVFEKYVDMLNKRREQTMTELSRLQHELESKIMRTSTQISNTSEKIRDALGFTERLIKHGNTMEMLCTMSMVDTQMLQVIHSVPSAQFSVRVNFVSDEKVFEDALNKNTGYFHADLEQKATQNFATAATPTINGNNFYYGVNNLNTDVTPLTPCSSSTANSNSSATAMNFEQNIKELARLGPMQQFLPQYPSAELNGMMNSGTVSPSINFMKRNGTTNYIQGNQQQLLVSTSRNVSPLYVNGMTTPACNDVPTLGAMGNMNGPHYPMSYTSGYSPPSDVSSSSSNGILHGLPPNIFSSQIGGANLTGLNPPIRQGQMHPMSLQSRIGSLGPLQGQFNSPHGFCLSPDEDIVVADTNNHRIQLFTKLGEYKGEFGVAGKDEGQLWYPRKVAILRNSGKFIVCDRGNERSRMQLFSKNGHFIKKIAIRYIDIVAGLAIDQEGRVVAVDSVSPTVFCIDENGELFHWFDCSNQMKEPSDIAVFQREYFICDFKGHCVCVFSDQGAYLRKIGCEGVTNFPNGIDISDHGDILIGDSHGNRFHVAVYKKNGELQSEFECPVIKVSRCCGLRITSEGYIITIAKNNHNVLILNTLYLQ